MIYLLKYWYWDVRLTEGYTRDIRKAKHWAESAEVVRYLQARNHDFVDPYFIPVKEILS
jgi:hypothetical protein